MNRWRLLLTRSAPDCQIQAKQLTSMGITAAYLPLLEIIPLAETTQQKSQLLDFDRYTTLIVISKPAAKLIIERLDHYWPQLPIQQTWFTVGKASAELLKEANLNAHYPDPTTGDDSEALWTSPIFQQNLANPNCRILIIKGQGGRQWLTEKLQLKGIPTETIELYQRKQPIGYTTVSFWKILTTNKLNGIVISSGQALENLYKLTIKDWQKLSNLVFLVPSIRVAKQAEELGIRHIINCHGASQNALINTLKTHQPHNLL